MYFVFFKIIHVAKYLVVVTFFRPFQMFFHCNFRMPRSLRDPPQCKRNAIFYKYLRVTRRTHGQLR